MKSFPWPPKSIVDCQFTELLCARPGQMPFLAGLCVLCAFYLSVFSFCSILHLWFALDFCVSVSKTDDVCASPLPYHLSLSVHLPHPSRFVSFSGLPHSSIRSFIHSPENTWCLCVRQGTGIWFSICPRAFCAPRSAGLLHFQCGISSVGCAPCSPLPLPWLGGVSFCPSAL